MRSYPRIALLGRGTPWHLNLMIQEISLYPLRKNLWNMPLVRIYYIFICTLLFFSNASSNKISIIIIIVVVILLALICVSFYLIEGALSIEVWGHRSAGFSRSKPGWEVEQQQLAKARSLADRWSELTRKIELWVEIQELNEQGEYSPVEVAMKQDTYTGKNNCLSKNTTHY